MVFFKLDTPINTRVAIDGVVVERTKSTYGYRQIGTVDVVKIKLSNGALVSYQRSNLRVGDKVVYEIYKGKYTGREVYKPKPTSFIPLN